MYEQAYVGSHVLVTGGAGFLGSNLVKRLATHAEKVWVLDDLFTGRRDSVPIAENVVFVQGSVTDGALLRELLSQVDYVFHFAARNISLSVLQPEADFQVNAWGSAQLLLNAIPFKHQIKRIVYASTSSIYGQSKTLPAQEGSYDISSPYAASKFSGELMAIAYAKMFQLPVTCFRFSNVYGPGQLSSNPYCGVVSKFMNAIVQGQPLTIYGDGQQTRDFTYVADAMDAVLLGAQSTGTCTDVFNIGTGHEVSVHELAQQMLHLIQDPAYPIQYAKKRAIDTINRRSVDATHLHTRTGWAPQHTLSEGLRKTWSWFQTTT